jgi:nicotinamidase-related amidase
MKTKLVENSQAFLEWLSAWQDDLRTLPFQAAMPHPERAALLCVDLTVGFAYQGPLSSPRVAGTIPSIVRLFERANAEGVRHLILPQDCHTEQALEFDSFGPHCTCGSRQAQTVPELQNLPFSERFRILPKDSISSSIGTGLDSWLNAHHQDVDTFVVVGDCTDLCTFHLAMDLRLRANALGYRHTIIVPADCVQTYDLPVDTAQELGIMPHHGDLMHAIFLYQMALNGITVVSSIT